MAVTPISWGWTLKKPQKQWLEQDPECVRAWLGEEFPAIQARAKRQKAVLLFGDEIRVLDFCDKLLEHIPDRKIFLILDNASFHTSPAITYWLKDNPRMEIFFLPPYAPELNPTGLFNQDVHSHFARGHGSSAVSRV